MEVLAHTRHVNSYPLQLSSAVTPDIPACDTGHQQSF